MRNKLFKIVGVVALLAVIGLAASKVIPGPEGTNGTLINPYDVYDETHRIRHMKQGSVIDSIQVHDNATDYTRRVSFGQLMDSSPAAFTINNATVGLTKANLNSTYPNVPVGYRVMCPSITLGGAVYMKATENGSSDVWQTISAPPTL